MTQTELAKLAGISKTGLLNIENGTADPKASTLAAIQEALEKRGIEFIEGKRPGVRLKDWVASQPASIATRRSRAGRINQFTPRNFAC